MRRMQRESDEEVNYWKSVADALIALLLVVLLFVLLFALKIFSSGEEIITDKIVMTTAAETVEAKETLPGDQKVGNGQNIGGLNGGDLGRGGAGTGVGYGPEMYEQPHGGTTPAVSAVKVLCVDSETNNVIKEAGVVFELFDHYNISQSLHTYYPEKQTYQNFVTTENGNLYLPETVPIGSYYLKNLSEPRGYDLAEDTYFTIDEGHAWSDAYEIKIKFSPSTNLICIMAENQDTHAPISGAKFRVIAAENITTLDNTVRFQKGEIAGEIECGEDGYGESGELYLGNYIIEQAEVPEGYVRMTEPAKITVGKKEDQNQDVQIIEMKKTVMIIYAYDEYSTDITLPGASFLLNDDRGNSVQFTSDEQGMTVLSDLKKDTTYELYQTKTLPGYQIQEGKEIFYVDTDGRINGNASEQITIANRMIRTTFSVEDIIFKNKISGFHVVLSDASGNVVREWNSGNSAENIQGIEAGEYLMSVQGTKNIERRIIVEDRKEIQNFDTGIITYPDLAAAAVTIVIFAIFAVLIIRSTIAKKSGRI